MITPIEIESEDFFVMDKERNLMTLVFYGVHINPDPLYRTVVQGVLNEVAFHTRLMLQSHIKFTILSYTTKKLNNI